MILDKIGHKKVGYIMPQASLEEAASKMRNEHLGDLIVVKTYTQGNRPIGIITDRDIVVSTIALGLDPRNFQVEDVMTVGVVTAFSYESVSSICEKMKKNGCQRIPLTDPKGFLVGVVSADDLLLLLTRELSQIAELPLRRFSRENQKRKEISQ